MLEQIMTTHVGMIGFLGFVAVALVGFVILAYIKKEVKDSDE